MMGETHLEPQHPKAPPKRKTPHPFAVQAMASLTRGGCGDEATTEGGRANSRDHRQMYKKGVSPVTFEDRVKNAKQRQRDIRHKLLAQARSVMMMQRHTGDGAESSMHVEIDNEAG